MTYQEAKKKANLYGLNEWDFKTLDGFIFAVEFFEEEAIKIKREQEYQISLKGHRFSPERKCSCGFSLYDYFSLKPNQRPSCNETKMLLERLDIGIKELREKCLIF